MAHLESHSNTGLGHSASTGMGEPDEDIVALWLKKDVTRWFAGVLAGVLAGAMSLAFAMVLAKSAGLEVWYPARIPALPFLGGDAMEFANQKAIWIGIGFHSFICAVLGFVYAHFTATNALSRLLGAGFVWGIFSWIFISNLFAQSFPAVSALQYSRGAALFVNLVFGLSLTSVAFFDQVLRGKKSAR